jgi:hypothetical protein
MYSQKIIKDEEQKVEDDIQMLKSKIAELEIILRTKELELEKKRKKGTKNYLIEWVKHYTQTGEVEIEAFTEKEAMQIAKDNIGCYEGYMELEYDKSEIECWGEVKSNNKEATMGSRLESRHDMKSRI